MLKSRADVNFINEHGNSPLHYACFWGYQGIAEDLVAQGGLVSLANKDGDTPLDKARGHLAKTLHGILSFFYCFKLDGDLKIRKQHLKFYYITFRSCCRNWSRPQKNHI